MNKRIKPIMGEPFDVNKIDEEIASLANDSVGHGAGQASLLRRPLSELHRPSIQPRPDDNQTRVEDYAPATAKPIGDVPEDPINPNHYRRHPSGIECIEIARHMTFNIGNAIKYLWRYQDKGDPIENLKKAQWYIDDEIRRLEGKR